MVLNSSNPYPALWIRASFVIGGIVGILLAAGFFFGAPFVTQLWPWPDGRLSYIFLASIGAAISAPMIWIGLSGETGASQGGAINLGPISAGMAVFLFSLYGRLEESRILFTALGCVVFVLVNVGLFIWSRRFPIRDRRPMPRPLRLAFMLFIGVLVLVGGALVMRAPTVFPWSLNPNSSVMFGIIFLGAAIYFLYALLIPSWNNARGQLIGFLVYDLVLIGPFLAHISVVKSAHALSLYIYISVLVFSGALAVYYLFLNPVTRSWEIQ